MQLFFIFSINFEGIFWRKEREWPQLALDLGQLSHPQQAASDWPQELVYGLSLSNHNSSSHSGFPSFWRHKRRLNDFFFGLFFKGLEMSLFRLVLWNTALKTASVFRKQHSFYCLQEKWHTAHYYIMIAQVLIQENVYTSICFDSFPQIKSPPK